jgi:hypothetical protein
MPRKPTTRVEIPTQQQQQQQQTTTQVQSALDIDLGNMFICSHQGRMQYLMGRELVNKDNELIIFSDLKIKVDELKVVKFTNYEKELDSEKDKINLLFDRLTEQLKNPAMNVTDKTLYDYFMCSSYIKFQNCAILRLKFEPTDDVTKLRIDLIHEGSLEKDEEIVANTEGKTVYWVKAPSQSILNPNLKCEFPTLELILEKSESFNIQGDIFVMRHGYAEHNRAKMDGSKKFYSDLTDAALTPAGVKQCVKAAEAFKKLSDDETVPSKFNKYCCSDLRRTWQSLSAFNSHRGVPGVDGDITMLPYMHEFEYKSIIPYAADDAFLAKGYLAAGGKFLGRASYLTAAVGLGSYLGATPLVAAGAKAVVGKALASKGVVAATSAGKALATKAAALQVPKVAAGAIAAGTGIAGAILDQYGTRADDKSEKGFLGLFKKPSAWQNYSKVRRKRGVPLPRGAMEYNRKSQDGGMKEGMARVALGEAGKGQFIRMLATENRSKLRGDGVFVGTEFTAEIPQLNTVTVNTDFYRTMKIDDPVLQEYRYTFFGILIKCNNHILTRGRRLKTGDLEPKDKRWFASYKRSLESKGSGQEKVSGKDFLPMGQEGGYKKTKKKTRRKKTSKKTRKKTKRTKMRKKKTHKRTKKNKKNKKNP